MTMYCPQSPAMMVTSSVSTATVYFSVVLLSVIAVYSLQPARAVSPCNGNSTNRKSLTQRDRYAKYNILHVMGCTYTIYDCTCTTRAIYVLYPSRSIVQLHDWSVVVSIVTLVVRPSSFHCFFIKSKLRWQIEIATLMLIWSCEYI